MGIKERAASRRAVMVVNRAANFEEAEAWDLDFWQRQSPEQRLSALVAIRRDVDKVIKARLTGEKNSRKDHTSHPRHQDDVRVLQEVRRQRKSITPR
jgi:hypothetical protein